MGVCSVRVSHCTGLLFFPLLCPCNCSRWSSFLLILAWNIFASTLVLYNFFFKWPLTVSPTVKCKCWMVFNDVKRSKTTAYEGVHCSHCEYFFSFLLTPSINCCHPHAHSRGHTHTGTSPQATCKRRTGEEQLLTGVCLKLSHFRKDNNALSLSLSLSPVRSQLPIRSRCLCYQVPLRQSRYVMMTHWKWLKCYRLKSHFTWKKICQVLCDSPNDGRWYWQMTYQV